MSVAIDSNVLVGLWNPNDALNLKAQNALDNAFASGGLFICGAVFGELLACPGRSEGFLDGFLNETNISVDWSTSETIWRTAGAAFQKYAARRRKQRPSDPRRILTDFYIGAHASCNGHSLLTLDDRIYQAAFPDLRIFRV